MSEESSPDATRTLVLFFTFGVSLATWGDVGMLDREVALYEELTDRFDRIVFVTYGTGSDDALAADLADEIEVARKRYVANDVLYSFLAPFIHYRTLRDADVLKTNQMLGSWTAVVTKYLCRAPLVVRTGYVLSVFYDEKDRHPALRAAARAVELLAYKTADGVITSSRDGFDYVEDTYRPPGVHRMLPNYIETDVFEPAAGAPSRDLCFVGRLAPQKNLFALFEALSDLPYGLTVVGTGDQRDDLEAYAADHGVDATFVGNVPNHELPDVLTDHRAFVLPSNYEGMPKSLLEAMACGLAVVGTDVTGINEVVTHEETGLLCEPTPAGLRDAIQRVMTDDDLRDELAAAARQHILDQYSLDYVVDQETALYDTVARPDADDARDAD